MRMWNTYAAVIPNVHRSLETSSSVNVWTTATIVSERGAADRSGVTSRRLHGEYALHAGDMLVFAAGVEHAAYSSGGCVLLLTVVHIDA